MENYVENIACRVAEHPECAKILRQHWPCRHFHTCRDEEQEEEDIRRQYCYLQKQQQRLAAAPSQLQHHQHSPSRTHSLAATTSGGVPDSGRGSCGGEGIVSIERSARLALGEGNKNAAAAAAVGQTNMDNVVFAPPTPIAAPPGLHYSSLIPGHEAVLPMMKRGGRRRLPRVVIRCGRAHAYDSGGSTSGQRDTLLQSCLRQQEAAAAATASGKEAAAAVTHSSGMMPLSRRKARVDTTITTSMSSTRGRVGEGTSGICSEDVDNALAVSQNALLSLDGSAVRWMSDNSATANIANTPPNLKCRTLSTSCGGTIVVCSEVPRASFITIVAPSVCDDTVSSLAPRTFYSRNASIPTGTNVSHRKSTMASHSTGTDAATVDVSPPVMPTLSDSRGLQQQQQQQTLQVRPLPIFLHPLTSTVPSPAAYSPTQVESKAMDLVVSCDMEMETCEEEVVEKVKKEDVAKREEMAKAERDKVRRKLSLADTRPFLEGAEMETFGEDEEIIAGVDALETTTTTTTTTPAVCAASSSGGQDKTPKLCEENILKSRPSRGDSKTVIAITPDAFLHSPPSPSHPPRAEPAEQNAGKREDKNKSSVNGGNCSTIGRYGVVEDWGFIGTTDHKESTLARTAATTISSSNYNTYSSHHLHNVGASNSVLGPEALMYMSESLRVGCGDSETMSAVDVIPAGPSNGGRSTAAAAAAEATAKATVAAPLPTQRGAQAAAATAATAVAKSRAADEWLEQSWSPKRSLHMPYHLASQKPTPNELLNSAYFHCSQPQPQPQQCPLTSSLMTVRSSAASSHFGGSTTQHPQLLLFQGKGGDQALHSSALMSMRHRNEPVAVACKYQGCLHPQHFPTPAKGVSCPGMAERLYIEATVRSYRNLCAVPSMGLDNSGYYISRSKLTQPFNQAGSLNLSLSATVGGGGGDAVHASGSPWLDVASSSHTISLESSERQQQQQQPLPKIEDNDMLAYIHDRYARGLFSVDDAYHRDEEIMEQVSISTTSSCAYGAGMDGLVWRAWLPRGISLVEDEERGGRGGGTDNHSHGYSSSSSPLIHSHQQFPKFRSSAGLSTETGTTAVREDGSSGIRRCTETASSRGCDGSGARQQQTTATHSSIIAEVLRGRADVEKKDRTLAGVLKPGSIVDGSIRKRRPLKKQTLACSTPVTVVVRPLAVSLPAGAGSDQVSEPRNHSSVRSDVPETTAAAAAAATASAACLGLPSLRATKSAPTVQPVAKKRLEGKLKNLLTDKNSKGKVKTDQDPQKETWSSTAAAAAAVPSRSDANSGSKSTLNSIHNIFTGTLLEREGSSRHGEEKEDEEESYGSYRGHHHHLDPFVVAALETSRTIQAVKERAMNANACGLHNLVVSSNNNNNKKEKKDDDDDDAASVLTLASAKEAWAKKKAAIEQWMDTVIAIGREIKRRQKAEVAKRLSAANSAR